MPLPNPDLEINRTARPDEKIPCPVGTQRDFVRKKGPISDDLGLRSPVIQELFQNEKCYFYRSICLDNDGSLSRAMFIRVHMV